MVKIVAAPIRSLWRIDFGFFSIASPMATAYRWGSTGLHRRHDPPRSSRRSRMPDTAARRSAFLRGVRRAYREGGLRRLRRHAAADRDERRLPAPWTAGAMVAQRRMKKLIPRRPGGWNIWIMPGSGLTPVQSGGLRFAAHGGAGDFGWPAWPRLVELRQCLAGGQYRSRDVEGNS